MHGGYRRRLSEKPWNTSSSYLLVLPKTLYGANVNHDYGELSVSYPYFLYLFPSKEMDDLGVPCR